MWAWRYSKKVERIDAIRMSGKSIGFTWPKAGFHRQTCKCRHLPRAFETVCGPLGLKDVSWQKIFLWIQRRPTLQHHPVAVGGIPVSGGSATIFADLNSLGLSTCSVLQPKGHTMPHANLAALHLSIAAEWDRLAAVLYISAKHALHSAAAIPP